MKIVRSPIIENKFIVRNATIKGGGGGRMNGERFLPTSTLYCIERNFARLYLMEFNFLFSGHSPHFIVRSTFSQFCFWRDIRQTFQILNFYLARRFFFLLFFFFFSFSYQNQLSAITFLVGYFRRTSVKLCLENIERSHMHEKGREFPGSIFLQRTTGGCDSKADWNAKHNCVIEQRYYEIK